jgi:hypothetical protein
MLQDMGRLEDTSAHGGQSSCGEPGSMLAVTALSNQDSPVPDSSTDANKQNHLDCAPNIASDRWRSSWGVCRMHVTTELSNAVYVSIVPKT